MPRAAMSHDLGQESGAKGRGGGLHTSVAYTSVVLMRPTFVQFWEKHSSASAGP